MNLPLTVTQNHLLDILLNISPVRPCLSDTGRQKASGPGKGRSFLL